MKKGVPGLALAFAFLLAGALTARALGGRAWNSFVHYRTPFAFTSEPGAVVAAPLADRLVVVLVDGLTTRASREMGFLNELRRRGADLEGQAGQPSLSLPGRAVILSGAWAGVHDQTTNFGPHPLTVEHLFGLAHRQGRRTALAAGPSPHRLVEGHVDVPVVFAKDPVTDDWSRLEVDHEERVGAAARLLREARADLAMAELILTDEVAHRWGAVSPDYARAVQRMDRDLRRLAAEIDLSRSVLVVTSDHGHVARGGHGGSEPEVLEVPVVLVGGPVRPGSRGRCLQADLAPTAAVLLGLPIPASSQGRVLWEQLEVDLATRREAEVEQRERFAARYAAWLEGAEAPAAVAVPAALGARDAPSRLAAAAAREVQARQDRLARDRWGRLPVAVLMVQALPVLLVLVRLLGVPGGEIRAALLGGTAALVLHQALFPVVGLGYSFSLMNKEEELPLFFRKDIVLTLACQAVAVAATTAWRRRLGPLGWIDASRLAALVAASFTGLLWIRVGVVYAWTGVFVTWQLPDIRWAFAFYLDVLAVLAAGLASPLLALLAVATARLAGGRVTIGG